MFGLGAPELLIILVVILVLFGGAKLPKLARSLGQAKNEFEAGTKEQLTPAQQAELKQAELKQAELKKEA